MNSTFANIDLNKIQQAIDVEIKHQYIDIRGVHCNFSVFIKNELKKIYKNSKKNPKWTTLIEAFEHYSLESMPTRKRMLERLVKTIRQDLENKEDVPKTQNFAIANPDEYDITFVKGVGPKVGYLFNKLGIFTVLDLLQCYPKKYIDYSKHTLIKNMKENESVTVFGCVRSVNAFTTKNKLSILKLCIEDNSGKLELNFFYAKANRVLLERYKAQFPIGANIMVSGVAKLDNYSGKITLDKPQYQIVTADFDDKQNLNMGRIVPIYPLVERLSAKTLRTAIHNSIKMFKSKIENILPSAIIDKYGLISKADAIEQIHFPESMEKMEKARFSLVFEELFILQLKLILFREENNRELKAIPIKIKENGLVQTFIKNLPFEMTDSQKNAVREIVNDLNSEKPMQRLLQGDVGSGKTVVALVMLLSAIENGYQTAIMAPTEILAQQHYNNIIQWLTPLGLSAGLFVGTNSKQARSELETNLQNGQMHVAVGTHALIQNNICFKNLGAIVIDEQHRFGVKQRAKLREKGLCPQILSMSATPIPRTLALTVHGDMDISIINELPKGRLPIKTSLIKASQRKEAYKLIDNEIKSSHQAYIVYPLIEESESISAKAATIEWERLQKEVFPQYKIGLLHGKLKSNEKDTVMNDFKKGKYQILVSTTVVEVGVDVPNATVIIIENAERFGLSQLHQLRGRTGRSALQSYCVLVSSSTSQETMERLKIMTETTDGFVIAEKDLELRGPGDFLGTKQSGLPDLLITDLTKDIKILELARTAAIEYFNENDITTDEIFYKKLTSSTKNNATVIA